jgi:biopolymer transport protein TolQ
MHLFASHPLFSAYSQADFFGKCIFFALFVVSAICWIVLIHKGMQVHQAKKHSFTFAKSFEKHKDRLLSLNIDPKKQIHPFARVFADLKQKTVEILNKNQYFSEEREHVYLTRSDIELLESHVLTTISSEAKRLEKNLFVLSTIVSLAPFLGLLGTVWGILVTFGEFQSGSGGLSNSAVLGGLSTALVTTVLGLLIAIPALVSSNWLRNAFNALNSDMEDFLYQLLSTLEFQYRKPT